MSPSISDYRRRAARAEMELKMVLLAAGAHDVHHLSPEDSPDLVAEISYGRDTWIEAKCTTKDSFYALKDPDTSAQYERLVAKSQRGYSVWYAVKFMNRGWRFYAVRNGPSFKFADGLPLSSFLLLVR